MVQVILPWSTALQPGGAYTAQWNLLSQFQSGQFTTVQSVLVDNNTVPYEIILTEQENGQRIRIPPFAQGLYPVLASAAPKFTAQLSAVPDAGYGTVQPFLGTTTFYFLNTPHAPFETKQLAAGENFLTAAGSVAPFGAAQQVLPALGGKQHYAISGLSLALFCQFGGYSGATMVTISVLEGTTTAPSFVPLWADMFVAPAGLGLLYSGTVTFPIPIITRQPTQPIGVTLSTFPPSASLVLAYQFLYGVVTIQ